MISDFLQIVAIFGTVGLVVTLSLIFRFLTERQRQMTIRSYVERGQQVPPELLAVSTSWGPRWAPRFGPRFGIYRGVRQIGIGMALVLFFRFLSPGSQLWAIGLLVAGIGASRLLASLLIPRQPL